MHLETIELLTLLTETQEKLHGSLLDRLVAQTDDLLAKSRTASPEGIREIETYLHTYRVELNEIRENLIRYHAHASRMGNVDLIAKVVALDSQLNRLDDHALTITRRCLAEHFRCKPSSLT